MKWTKTEKRQLAIFFAVAFGVPYLMGVAMALVHSMGGSTAVFANAQMFYPAAGAMLALLVTRRGDKLLPRRFYFGFLALDKEGRFRPSRAVTVREAVQVLCRTANFAGI